MKLEDSMLWKQLTASSHRLLLQKPQSLMLQGSWIPLEELQSFNLK